MNNHRKGINNRFNLQICYDLKFRTFTLHSYPDQDIPGEKLYLQLTRIATQAGLTLIRHSLPPGCKDYSDYYLRQHRDEKQPLTVTP